MSKDTDNSLFINSSMPRFYQQLISGIGSYQELGNRIIKRIKAAHAFRQIEQVRQLSRVLINNPIREFQLIAQYYLVWCKCRDYEYPAVTLEKIIEQTRTYKTKALFSRAAIEIYHGNLEHALYFYGEAFKSHPTASEYIDLSRSIAGLKSLEGFHDSALRDLEKLIPLIRHAEPRLYYDFLNSYAVELGVTGRKQEARSISQIVLTSPFAYAYPEWQDTANDLKPANRSFAVIRPKRIRKAKILRMPLIKRSEPTEAGELAPVVSLPEWKEKKMAKDKKGKNGNGKKIDEMTEKDFVMETVNMLTNPEVSYEQRRKIYEYTLKVLSEPEKPKPDDDDTEGA